MTTRGVNGATSGTLNERFIKCNGCSVNVPKEDMLALGQCTVCGCPYEIVTTGDGRGVEITTVAFAGAPPEAKSKRKRWVVLTSKRGRTYYHNTETGEDRWDKPADLDAEAAENTFVPFKNDAVKKAVLREQMKLEATKMGMPLDVVVATQHQLQLEDEVDDPITKMMARGAKPKSERPKPESPKVLLPTHEEEKTQQTPEASNAGGSCVVM